MKQKWNLLLIPVTILVVGALYAVQLGIVGLGAQPKADITIQSLHEATNAERTKQGRTPLKLDERLNQSAQRKAEELAIEKHFEHKNLAGISGHTYVYATFKDCDYASENLARDSRNTAATIDGLMHSNKHRWAILDDRYDYVGFGYKDGYVVQHFCDLR